MRELANSAGFESYGTRVLFRSNDRALLDEVLETAETALLGKMTPRTSGEYDVVIDVIRSGRNFRLERNGAYISHGPRNTFFKFLNAIIRVSVAEFSPELVFLHAGAVSWRGKGIVMPADSFTGKSSLVTELVKCGAEYYSDDFAIVDKQARLHPFSRQISMRTRERIYSQYEVDPRDLGAAVGSMPIPIGLVLLTRYKAHARFSPTVLSSGAGLLKIVPFALGMSKSPGNCLSTLNDVLAKAVIIETSRGDAARTAVRLLDFFDKNVI